MPGTGIELQTQVTHRQHFEGVSCCENHFAHSNIFSHSSYPHTVAARSKSVSCPDLKHNRTCQPITTTWRASLSSLRSPWLRGTRVPVQPEKQANSTTAAGPESESEGAGKCWKCSLFLSVRKNWLFLWVSRPLGPSLTLLFFHIYSSTTLDFEALLFVISSKHSSCFDLSGTPHGEWWECGSFARGLGASIVQTDWFSPYVNAWLAEFSINRCFCGTSRGQFQ